MLRDPVLTLVGAMELCRAAETTQAQMKVLNPVEFCWGVTPQQQPGSYQGGEMNQKL